MFLTGAKAKDPSKELRRWKVTPNRMNSEKTVLGSRREREP